MAEPHKRPVTLEELLVPSATIGGIGVCPCEAPRHSRVGSDLSNVQEVDGFLCLSRVLGQLDLNALKAPVEMSQLMMLPYL